MLLQKCVKGLVSQMKDSRVGICPRYLRGLGLRRLWAERGGGGAERERERSRRERKRARGGQTEIERNIVREREIVRKNGERESEREKKETEREMLIY